MTDPLAVANLALSVLGETTKALNALRERAQRSRDMDIKDQINTLYDHVLQLKEVVSRLVDENALQKRQLDEQRLPPEVPKIRQVGDNNYYFKDDVGPFCQPCYDIDKRLVMLSPAVHISGGGIRRSCPVCLRPSYERKKTG